MIIVTGATGQLGRLVVEKLLDRVPAGEIGASVRDPAKARDLADRGVRVRRGDFGDPASLADAFAGASRVLVVSTDGLGDSSVRKHGQAIDAAVAAGASRVVYTSHMGASPTSPFAPMPDHAATEKLLRDSGIAFTALRNGFYASSAVQIFGNAAQTGELVAPADGPVAWTAHADLAEAAAIALTSDALDGLTPALTAAETVDLAGIAEIASEITGRPIRRVTVSDADYRTHLLSLGLPDMHAELFTGLFAAARQGDFAPADPALATLLGHPATPLTEVFKAALA